MSWRARPSTDNRLGPEFFARPVVTVARDLLGCELRRGDTAGIIVETEAYHDSEPACHGYNGPTARAELLFGEPGLAYVYLSYGMHSLFNAVAERAGVGAAVLVRALQPTAGLERMRVRRGREALTDLCSGPAKLTQALGIGLGDNAGALADGPIEIRPRALTVSRISSGPRIGISKAVALPWRFAIAGNPHVSRPRI